MFKIVVHNMQYIILAVVIFNEIIQAKNEVYKTLMSFYMMY